MESSKDLVCEKGLRFNQNLGIIDTKGHHIYFKNECTKILLDILCTDCNEEKTKNCPVRKNFETFLK